MFGEYPGIVFRGPGTALSFTVNLAVGQTDVQRFTYPPFARARRAFGRWMCCTICGMRAHSRWRRAWKRPDGRPYAVLIRSSHQRDLV